MVTPKTPTSSKTPTTPRPAATLMSPGRSKSALSLLWSSYKTQTPDRLKFIDTFLLFILLSGITQFLYLVLVTDYPFNAFLAGFASTVGQFVLTASLRSQVNPENKAEFKQVSPERAFADFAMGSIVLHFFVFTFLG